ncbi:MAG TPA: ABC transporter ATP-binding protein [Pseudonocardia sp.]|jgi:peptide/nickel transport system ATP-binding protein|uniref:ABC transporter ATP-binding protein n=1 Tax=Pseudonocardia sp. TaxID=60912 RepID=UPI002ED78F19
MLLRVKELRTRFATDRGEVTAVDGVSFEVAPGEIVGLVGESGCGKSVTAESIMRLLDERSTRYSGEVLLDGVDLFGLTAEAMRQVRGGSVAMVFQDPMTSLNPVYTVGNQLEEAILLHQEVSREQARALAERALAETGIPAPASCLRRYPHELSGGMRQRVMIAMALSCRPKLLIADEPTTALDVTTQAQILDLIAELRDGSNMGTVLITHDMGVVAEVCTRVVVMYLGQVIEQAPVDEIFTRPAHPYTRGLLASIPSLTGDTSGPLHVIGGKVPTLWEVPKGCRFADRCLFAEPACRDDAPELLPVDGDRSVRCRRHSELPEWAGVSHV